MSLDQLIQELLAALRANPQLAVLLGLAVLGGIGRLLGGKPERRPERRGTRGGSGSHPDRGGQGGSAADDAGARASELEERIRRNFEEMLRRRGGATAGDKPGAAATAESPAAAPPMAPPPSAPTVRRRSEPATAEPKRAPTRRNYEEGAARRNEGRSLEAPRTARAPLSRTRPKSKSLRRIAAVSPLRSSRAAAATATAAVGSRPRRADGAHGRSLLPDLDRAGLRRAFVMREVLGPPRALQELDEAAR